MWLILVIVRMTAILLMSRMAVVSGDEKDNCDKDDGDSGISGGNTNMGTMMMVMK